MRAPTRESLDLYIAFGSATVRVLCPSPAIYHVLQAHLRHCLAPIEAHTGAAVLHLSDAHLSADALLPLLMNQIVSRLIAPCRDSLALHAAGVTLGERGIVLCGASGSGKSTLTAHLIRQGFGYLSDEVIAVTHSTAAGFALRGFPRSLVVKAGSAAVWRPFIAAPPAGEDDERVRHFADGSAWIPPDVLRPQAVRAGARAALLVFPRYDPAVSFHKRLLSPAHAAFMLLENLANARNLHARGLLETAALVKACPTYQVTYNHAAHVADWLLSIT